MRLSISLILLLLLLVIAGFAGIQHHDFISYDDKLYVLENPHVLSGLNSESVKWAFSTLYTGNWHPLTWLSHMADCEIFGINPKGHHLVNLGLHLLNTILLYLVLARTTGARFRSFIVAALFGIHPVHVESVAWVAERKDVLSSFFWFLTMAAYGLFNRSRSIFSYILVFLFLLLGLMSKAMLVTLPLVLLLMDFWPLRRMDSAKTFFMLVLEKVPLFLLAGLVLVITFIGQQLMGHLPDLEQYSWMQRGSLAVLNVGRYALKVVSPADLSVLYQPSLQAPAASAVMGACAFAGITTLCALALLRRAPYVLAGWLWYVLTLLPVSGLVQIGYLEMADRYTYIPAIGLFILLVWSLGELFERVRFPMVLRYLCVILFLASALAVTRKQVKYWRNSVTLFEHALEIDPQNYRAHMNLAEYYKDVQNYDASKKHLVETLKIRADLPDVVNNLGLLYAETGDHKEAIKLYQQSIDMRPGHAPHYNNMGNAYFLMGDYDKAIKTYSEALRLDPEYSIARENMKRALQKKVSESIGKAR